MSQTGMLAERYELGETLGRGGMAEVVEGHDTRLGRRVAIKVLRADLARDPSFHSRFQREAQAAASLNHPNIVAVYDTGEDVLRSEPTTPVPFIVMEFVDGITLRQLLQSGRKIMPERAMEIIAGTLSALDYSHRHGIVHRDIKPGNVMLTRSGEVKVMDFGIARALADQGQTMTSASAVLGTAAYLSPEQARGELVDARSDIYSAGCVLYELLTGRPPFTGESPVSIAYQHVSERPIAPTQIDPSLPATIDNIVLTALAKKPEDRYASASEFRSDLERVLAGSPASASPRAVEVTPIPESLEHTRSMAPISVDSQPTDNRRNPLLWVGLSLVVVGLITGMVFFGRTLFSGSSAGISVPDLRGLTIAEAQNELSDRGLELGKQTQAASETVPADRIVSQDPGNGATLSRGDKVDVVISTGTATATAPELLNLVSVADARAKLTEVGLVLGTVTEVASTQPAGQVVAQDPDPGTQLRAGDRVNIQVSNGSTLIPDVIGRSEAQARAVLTNAGFDVVVEYVEDNVNPAGTVIGQAPDPGTPGRTGATVSISVVKKN